MNKSIHRALFLGAILITTAGAQAAESFASAVLSYTAGTPGPIPPFYTDPASVLGKPVADTGLGPVSPFSPHHTVANLVSLGEGGHLTLQLANYVLVDNTPGVRELGVWESVFLNGAPPTYDGTTNPATVTGSGSAVVQVSADNVTWFALNNGNRITFDLPGNYYANSTGAYDPAPTNPINADYGKPFLGTVASFDNQNYAQVLATLNGSAGGNWLDIDASFGLSQVGYVRFSGVPAGEKLDLDAVAINGSRIGAAVPEPGAVGLLASAFALFGIQRFRRP